MTRELEKRQGETGGTSGGAVRDVERKQGEESECLEEAKEASEEKEQEAEGQSGGGAIVCLVSQCRGEG